MDEETRIGKLKRVAKEISEKKRWTKHHTAEYLSQSMIGEATDLFNIFKDKSEKEAQTMFEDLSLKDQIGRETADLFALILLFSEKYKVDLSTEISKRFHRVDKNYPPERWDKV